MTSPSVDEFVVVAREFCSFAEATEPVKDADLWRVREMLLRLLFHVTALEKAPKAFDSEGKRPDDALIKKVAARFSGFAFDHYRVVFDPHDFTKTDEPVVGMLWDDLADIYRDLAEGLDNVEKGHLADACSDWTNSYKFHWARHAVNALAALEIYRMDNFLEIEEGE